jgi:hypothetical protein
VLNDDVGYSPSIVDVEKEISETIMRQTAIADSMGMHLDDYREHLADRRDELLDGILHLRAIKRMTTG